MAYTDPTVLLTFQGGKTLTELRDTKYGMLRAFEASTPFYKGLTPELKTFLATRMDRTAQIAAIPETIITTTTSESFTIPANLSVSENKTATIYTLFSGFKVYDAMFVENQISKEEYIRNKMEEIDKAFAKAKSATLLTILDGAKTQVLPNNPAANDGITFAASTLTATLAAQQARIFNNLNVIAEDNGLENDKIFPVSPGIQVLENYNDMYGMQNTKDLQNQGFIPAILPDNRITNTARWTGYLFEKGAFAAVDNMKYDFRVGTKVNEAVFGVSNTILPKLGSQVGTFYNKFATDASGLQGTTSTWKMTTGEEFGFIHRYAVLTPYNSDITTKLNPVIKIVGAV